MEIRRCRHIKVNGTQCGSPALRGRCYCYFHHNWRSRGTYGAAQRGSQKPCHSDFPVLEDANSVQAALMQVIRLMLAKEISPKEAGLLLYALQIASSNLRHLRLEPGVREQVVVDPALVQCSPLNGYPAREEDFEAEEEAQEKEDDVDEEESETEVSQNEGDPSTRLRADLRRLGTGVKEWKPET